MYEELCSSKECSKLLSRSRYKNFAALVERRVSYSYWSAFIEIVNERKISDVVKHIVKTDHSDLRIICQPIEMSKVTDEFNDYCTYVYYVLHNCKKI